MNRFHMIAVTNVLYDAIVLAVANVHQGDRQEDNQETLVFS
jgi:hypothetical protein